MIITAECMQSTGNFMLVTVDPPVPSGGCHLVRLVSQFQYLHSLPHCWSCVSKQIAQQPAIMFIVCFYHCWNSPLCGSGCSCGMLLSSRWFTMGKCMALWGILQIWYSRVPDKCNLWFTWRTVISPAYFSYYGDCEQNVLGEENLGVDGVPWGSSSNSYLP